jgi:hypothetical protein
LTAQTQGSAEQLAGPTAPLADETVATTWAFIHGMRHQLALALQMLPDNRLVR